MRRGGGEKEGGQTRPSFRGNNHTNILLTLSSQRANANDTFLGHDPLTLRESNSEKQKLNKNQHAKECHSPLTKGAYNEGSKTAFPRLFGIDVQPNLF